MMFVAIFGTSNLILIYFSGRLQKKPRRYCKAQDKRDMAKVNQPHIAKKEINLMRKDTAIGMAFSQIIMWAIITTTAGSSSYSWYY